MVVVWLDSPLRLRDRGTRYKYYYQPRRGRPERWRDYLINTGGSFGSTNAGVIAQASNGMGTGVLGAGNG